MTSREELIDYISRYGGRCRDCGDEDGVCPTTGIGCGESRKAIGHVLDAYIYGVKHGFITPLDAALAARPAPEAGSVVDRLRSHCNGDRGSLSGIPLMVEAADLIEAQAAAITAGKDAHLSILREEQARAERLEEVVQNALAAGLPEEVAISARAALQQEGGR